MLDDTAPRIVISKIPNAFFGVDTAYVTWPIADKKRTLKGKRLDAMFTRQCSNLEAAPLVHDKQETEKYVCKRIESKLLIRSILNYVRVTLFYCRREIARAIASNLWIR